MIENKLVTITKENTFSDMWRLLVPYQAPVNINQKYLPLTVGDVVSKITKSTGIYLVLGEACLAGAIVRELEWVQKYIAISIAVKSTDILSVYKGIKFAEIKVDPAIAYNYMCIKGDYDFCLFIDNMYCKTDNSVAGIYFGEGADNFSKYFDDALAVMLCGTTYNEFWLKILAAHNVANVFGVVESNNYNEQLYEDSKKLLINLLVAESVKNGVLVFTSLGEILLVSYLDGKGFVSVPVDRLDSVVSRLYCCVYKTNHFDQLTNKKGVAVWQDGLIKTLDVKDNIVVERVVILKEMGDFIAEKFDRSEVNYHNTYAAQARSVIYKYTLIPPTLEGEYSYSSIYKPVQELYEQLSCVPIFEVEAVMQELKGISESNGLLDILNMFFEYKKWASRCIGEYKYNGYYAKINAFYSFTLAAKDTLLSACLCIFKELNNAAGNVKFSKFDTEIEDYRKIISEKQLLISRGEDVLGNKRRVEILEKKIRDLIQLKSKFQGSAAESSDDAQNDFLAFCKESMLSKGKIESGESIEKIMRKDEGKIYLLKAFVKKYLYSIVKYFEDISVFLGRLCDVVIPEDYIVYEKDGKRYIFIDDENEFMATTYIRRQFNLNCVARR